MGKERLNRYIASIQSSSFEWGKLDCLIFSNNAFKEYWGFGYADDWIGRYMNADGPKTKDQLRKEFGYMRLEPALDDRLRRCPAVVQGALVTTKKTDRWITGVALGISIGSRCIFLSKEGMVLLYSEDVEAAWMPNEP